MKYKTPLSDCKLRQKGWFDQKIFAIRLRSNGLANS